MERPLPSEFWPIYLMREMGWTREYVATLDSFEMMRILTALAAFDRAAHDRAERGMNK